MTATATHSASPQAELFAEFVDSRGRKLTVDREASTVDGVKLMGWESKNKRRFSETARRNLFELSEAAKINVNHNTKDLTAPREYGDRFGSVVSRTLEADGIYGKIRVNPKHPLAEQFFWDAENAPQNCGMSPVYAPSKTSRSKDGFLLVESVARVSSIDLVADPATTNSLQESQEGSAMSEQILAEALTAKSNLEKQVNDLTAQIGTLAGEKKALAEQVDTLTAKITKGERAAAVAKLIAEAKLPAEAVLAETQASWESSEPATAEKLVKNFAEAYHRSSGKPKSDPPASGTGGASGGNTGGTFDPKAFASRLKKSS
jgi:peptidoglycan hydrolase CwlO-like protein